MGIDALDMMFRLERAFKFRPSLEDFGMSRESTKEIARRGSLVITAGEVCDAVIARMRFIKAAAQRRDLPYPKEWDMSDNEVWETARREIGMTVKLPPEKVSRDSRIVEDLGFT